MPYEVDADWGSDKCIKQKGKWETSILASTEDLSLLKEGLYLGICVVAANKKQV